MIFEVAGKRAFAYTAAHELDPAKPTVVFVHGAGLDHSLFGLQSRYFGYHGRNVLALDLPGHGRSEGPALGTIEEMADWVSEVLSKLKIEKAALVGHSMGSLVVLEFAARHPQQAERIAFCSIAFPMKVSEPFLEAARTNDYAAFDMHTIWGHAAQVRLERLGPGVLHAGLKACNDYAAGLESAAKVKCPALFILGRRDVMTPLRASRALYEKFAEAKIVEVPVSGHTPMAEAPDATLDALIAFIS
jgi:pimeloyl-ACP methyl ester carboxylesterase